MNQSFGDLNNTRGLFTASEIALCLDKTPQAVRKQLQISKSDGIRIVAGQETACWSWAALPLRVQMEWQRAIELNGFRNAEQMIRAKKSNADETRPRYSLSDICPEDIAKATKLRAALAVVFQSVPGQQLSCAQIEAAAAREFEKQFGYTVSDRQIRNLIARARNRAGSMEDWSRLELYLPENPRLKSEDFKAPRIQRPNADMEFADMAELIKSCSDPKKPNSKERNAIWTVAFQKHNQLTGCGMHSKAASRKIRDFLFFHAPFLAPSRDALLKSFERKFSAWLKAGCAAKALRDGREDNSGNHDGYQLPEADRQLLTHRAVWKFGGRIAQAWRDVCISGELTNQTQQRYPLKYKNKSHVPHLVFDAVREDVEYMSILHRGSRAWDSAKGYVRRDYSLLPSLAVYQGDDVTLPVYFYIPTASGYKLTRGQCLIFICARSLRVLGYSLQPEKSYNSLVIRSQCVRLFSEYGPPNILYFERGLWERARLVAGSNEPSFVEVSQGLREFGIEFQHAIRPRSKVVERVIGAIQDRMEGEPGYCGRNERIDCPENVRKQMLAVNAGRSHPSEYFYSFEQWDERIGKIIEDYNCEPQQGHMLSGLSPEQALEKFRDESDPRIVFTPQIQHLLAYHKTEVHCTANGVTVHLRGERLNYKGAELAHLTGRRALVWLDPENLETAIVTDVDRAPESFARVPRSQSVQPFARDEQSRFVLAQELSKADAQLAPIKTRYHVIKAKFQMPKRITIADPQIVALGQKIREANEQDVQRKRTADIDARETRRLELGVNLPRALTAEQRKDMEDILKQNL